MKRIFAVGPNKCGTNSINQFLEANGIPAMHWDKGRLARRIVSNASAGIDPLRGYEDYRGFTDIFSVSEELYLSPVLIFDILRRAYPDDIYVLNLRSFENWHRSRDNHRKGSPRPTITARLEALFGSDYDARTEYEAFARLKQNPPARFHVLDLEQEDAFETLAVFLEAQGFEICERAPRHANRTADLPRPGRLGRVLNRLRRGFRRA
ncbi:sulfotransferase [Sagittula salina]|uniref:Sulfotransferase family protein n=1 Tax=Sagittula salina TaxID=2820268 RepID=A0A940MRG0_9RHOB|nr:sulfotransferase [Sagittula salina]MBP0484470.1 hypothetical protein [Sagittula salina]